MSKTNFIDGSPVTPAFLNAINNPTFVEEPVNDGEINFPHLSVFQSFDYWGVEMQIPADSVGRYIGDALFDNRQFGNTPEKNGDFLCPFTGI